MLVLVSGATATVRKLHPARNLGVLVTPRAMQSLDWIQKSGITWACDNDCYRALDEDLYGRMVDRVARQPWRCRFITVPDVVADHDGTLDQWEMWYPRIAETGISAAFVLQDGATSETIPWHQAGAIFLGGSTEYKLSAAARALCLEARRRGKWVHIGRVNSARRERLFAEVCDSFDGSQYSLFARRHLPPCLTRLEHADRQMAMNVDAAPHHRQSVSTVVPSPLPLPRRESGQVKSGPIGLEVLDHSRHTAEKSLLLHCYP